MTPELFSGAWRRRSVSIDGSAPGEPADVYWLQVGDEFIDVRRPRSGSGGTVAPLSGPGAFAGRTTWDEPVLTWHHRLDSAGLDPVGESAQDQGVLSWDGGHLVEAGTFEGGDGPAVGYVEVWERLADTEGTSRSYFRTFADGTGCLARVGDHRLGLVVGAATGDRNGAWAATHHRLVAGVWCPTIRIGDELLLRSLEAHARPSGPSPGPVSDGSPSEQSTSDREMEPT